MTADEWNHSHPEQCKAYLHAWTEQQKRHDRRQAHLMLTIAQSGGVKIGGRKPSLNDFLPDYAKPKRRQRSAEEIEADLKATFRKLANHTQPNGPKP